LKRIAKLLISIVFAAASGFAGVLLGLFGRRAPRCVVLYYHSIPEGQRPLFARQMDILLSLSEPLRADHGSPLVPGKRYSAVTFDDAFRNNIANALPELKSRKIPATIFVAPGLLGKSWHDDSAQSDADGAVMSEQELKEIRSEFVQIGSHSMSHPNMTHLAPAEAKAELIESRRTLQNMLGIPINSFSFPYGSFNDDLVKWAREAGYQRVFTTLPDSALAEPAEFVSPRVRVDPTDWELEFRLKLLGAYRWLPAAFALKRALFPKRLAPPLPQRASAGE
jgi:peptidoglycan/xylan/chitin deacetylase (PgdA/CDA1 family)